MMGETLPVDLVSLQEFCKLSEKDRIWREEFTPIIEHTANTSELIYPWELFREIIKARLIYVRIFYILNWK
ncbi:hypothetical protein HMI56_005118 [Coelomomyces lativittatus]|nr:hypothetical protein HMI56_005118 [Coelomomyces lativittatus]